MNILLLQLKRIGDLILTTPAIAAVREKFPAAKISLVVSARAQELLPAIAGVDRTFVARSQIGHAADWFTLVRKKYDYCFDFTRTDRSSFLTLLSGARKRVTADHPKQRAKLRSLSYNAVVDLPIGRMHTVDYHLALLEPLGIRDASPRLQLHLPASAREEANRALSDAGVRGEYLLLHPGSARLEKFWEAKRWAALADFAAKHELACVITGGPSTLEQNHIREIKKQARHPLIDLSGKIGLLALAAVIERARLLTTVDSAPVHLAAATQTPQVVLFGPTNPFHWHPRFTPALVLQAGHDKPLTDFAPKQRPAAMNQISTAQVIDAMEALLASPRGAVV